MISKKNPRMSGAQQRQLLTTVGHVATSSLISSSWVRRVLGVKEPIPTWEPGLFCYAHWLNIVGWSQNQVLVMDID